MRESRRIIFRDKTYCSEYSSVRNGVQGGTAAQDEKSDDGQRVSGYNPCGVRGAGCGVRGFVILPWV